jgi:hypothetical protein
MRNVISRRCNAVTGNYRVFGLFPSSDILGTRKHDVSETGSVSVSGVGGKTSTQLDPLDKANLNHWTPPHLRPQTYIFPQTSFFLVPRIPDDGKKTKNPVILNVIHHQNPLDSTITGSDVPERHQVINERCKSPILLSETKHIRTGNTKLCCKHWRPRYVIIVPIGIVRI